MVLFSPQENFLLTSNEHPEGTFFADYCSGLLFFFNTFIADNFKDFLDNLYDDDEEDE